MSVTAVKAALAAQLATCPGLTMTSGSTSGSSSQVYAVAPENLVDLPALVVFAGPASIDVSPAGLALESREYRLRLYVTPRTAGAAGDAEAAANEWFNTLRGFLLARPTLPAAGGVLRAQYLGDSGLTVQPYAGQDYFAIDFRLAVTEGVPYAYAANF